MKEKQKKKRLKKKKKAEDGENHSIKKEAEIL